MKNMSMWVMVIAVALVGSAIWYEVQYRQGSKPEAEIHSPVRHTSTPKAAPAKPGQQPSSTNERGQLIG